MDWLIWTNSFIKSFLTINIYIYIYIYISRSFNEVLPRYVKSLSKKMTRIEFKFKISYGAIREVHFQTATSLSLKRKKEKKKETQYLIKRSNRLFTEQKKQKKKKKIKNPKTQIVFPDQNSYSLRLQILRCSFKHTDRTCVVTKTLKPKSYLPIKIQTHSDYRFFVVPSNTQIGLACSTLSNRRKKKKPLQQLKPLQRWKSLFVPCNMRFISYPASAFQQ